MMTETKTDSEAAFFVVPDRTVSEINREKLDTVRQEVLAEVKTAGQEELDAHFHLDPGAEGATERKESFLQEKEGLNIGECFSLLMSEKYLGKVHFVRLAYTDHTTPDASRMIFHDMNDFLRWFGQNVVTVPIEIDGVTIDSYISEPVGDDSVDENNPGNIDPQSDVDGQKNEQRDTNSRLEVDRHKSGRRMEYYYHGTAEDGVGHRAVITRTRPFIEARIMVNDVPTDILVYKKTVITLPASMLQNMIGDDNKRRNISSLFPPEEEPVHEGGNAPGMSYITMNNIERLMYTKSGEGIVQRVMTGIYAAVEPVKESHES